MYKYIEPEVAGGLGSETAIDTSSHPPVVTRLHYEFDGWLGNDLLESFPCFIVSDQLRQKIVSNLLTGVTFDEVVITKSLEFSIQSPNIALPKFSWMKIYGKIGESDFAIAEDFRLVVSQKAMEVLNNFNLSAATFEDYR